MLENDNIKSLLIRELVDNHECHTVIFYGSRARGDFNNNSDVDVLGIRDAGEAFRIGRHWNGFLLDAWVYAESNLPSAKNLPHIANGIVLVERNNFGTKLLKEVNNELCKPLTPLHDWELEFKVTWIEKMLTRAAVGDVEGDYRRHWLLMSLLEDWFTFSGLHYLGPKESLKYLEINESSTFYLFQRALKPDASLDAIAELGRMVIKKTRG